MEPIAASGVYPIEQVPWGQDPVCHGPAWRHMDTNTLLIILIAILLLGGGGWYGRGRWY